MARARGWSRCWCDGSDRKKLCTSGPGFALKPPWVPPWTVSMSMRHGPRMAYAHGNISQGSDQLSPISAGLSSLNRCTTPQDHTACSSAARIQATPLALRSVISSGILLQRSLASSRCLTTSMLPLQSLRKSRSSCRPQVLLSRAHSFQIGSIEASCA